jgi:protein O-mannosyl-transferase
VLACVVTVRVQFAVEGVRSLEEIPLPWRLANALIAYVVYLRKAIWPIDLAVVYPHPALLHTRPLSVELQLAAGAAAVLFAVSALCVQSARQRPYLLVGWLWYLIVLAPVIGVVQIGVQALADRYSYLSMIGVYIMVAWGGAELAPRWRRGRPVVAVAGVAILAAATWLSWSQIGTWRNSRALYEHALAVTTDNYVIHAALGAVLKQDGELDAAAAHLEESLRLRPGEPFTLTQLGTVMQERGRLNQAAELYETALRTDPGYVQAHGNLGVVRLRQNRLEEAGHELAAALAARPDVALYQSNMAALLMKQGRVEDAAPYLRAALALDPNLAEAHTNLGVVLVHEGELRAAQAEFETALRLDPGHPNAANNLAYVRAQLGR